MPQDNNIPPNPTRWKIWEYEQMGRVFIIDPAIGHDNNILNSVFEVMLPNSFRPPAGLTVQQYKDQQIAQKRKIADALMSAIGTKAE